MLEEAAYVDPGFFYVSFSGLVWRSERLTPCTRQETVAPLLLIGNTSLLAISTLTSGDNFYTRLLRMQDSTTGLPLFTSLCVQLACRLTFFWCCFLPSAQTVIKRLSGSASTTARRRPASTCSTWCRAGRARTGTSS